MTNALAIRFLGPTDFRGARLMVSDGIHRLAVGFDYADSDNCGGINAAIQKFNAKYYPKKLYEYHIGILKPGYYVAIEKRYGDSEE